MRFARFDMWLYVVMAVVFAVDAILRLGRREFHHALDAGLIALLALMVAGYKSREVRQRSRR